jgi:teichuronic acid exporter
MSLKQKTLSGLTWSFVDNFSNYGIQFIVGLILARLLSPKEFGLIGMITIFIAVSQSFIDSGFSQALIRKSNCQDKDYNTVFYFNLLVGVLFYFILFFCAGAIGNFFNEPKLVQLTKVLGINLIINGFGLIQRAILIKKINFKLQTKISIISSSLSGAAGIGLAFYGFGVWSLVAKTIIQNFCNSLLLWLWNNWKPQKMFSAESFREMFGFGSKLLLSGLIDTTYQNIYYLVIGKFFSAVELGYYTRAEQFRKLPSQNITSIIQRVSYPILSSIKDDPVKLKSGYKKLIKSTMYVSFILMTGMAAVAKPLVVSLVGEKWLQTVPYLQLLCFSSMLYPLHALNLNMLNVMGRSDLFLKLEIIKKVLAVPTIVIGIFWGVKIMIIGMIVNSFIGYYINSYWSGRLVNYAISEQINDIAPSLVLALVMGTLVYLSGVLLPFENLYSLIIQVALGLLIILGLSMATRIDAFLEIKAIIVEKTAKSKILTA